MKKLDQLKRHLDVTKESVDALARRSGVSRAAIYKFLDGGDIRLSTWEKIEQCLKALEAA